MGRPGQQPLCLAAERAGKLRRQMLENRLFPSVLDVYKRQLRFHTEQALCVRCAAAGEVAVDLRQNSGVEVRRKRMLACQIIKLLARGGQHAGQHLSLIHIWSKPSFASVRFFLQAIKLPFVGKICSAMGSPPFQ